MQGVTEDQGGCSWALLHSPTLALKERANPFHALKSALSYYHRSPSPMFRLDLLGLAGDFQASGSATLRSLRPPPGKQSTQHSVLSVEAFGLSLLTELPLQWGVRGPVSWNFESTSERQAQAGRQGGARMGRNILSASEHGRWLWSYPRVIRAFFFFFIEQEVFTLLTNK